MKKNWFPFQKVIGWILTILLCALLTISAAMKLQRNPEVIKQLVENGGYPDSSVVPIGVAEIASVALFLFPPTSIFGATLLTAYMGGAVSHHVRIGEFFVPQVVIGVLIWVAYVLRRPDVLRAGLGLKIPTEHHSNAS